MSDLIERLEARVTYYDDKAKYVSNMGRPRTDNDSGRTAALFEEAAARIKKLEEAAKAPLPEEIAGLIEKLKARGQDRSYATNGKFPPETFYEWQGATVLERMARENSGLKIEIDWHVERIKELEAERDAIEAATIEKCAQTADEWFFNHERSARPPLIEAIRALAKPSEKEET